MSRGIVYILTNPMYQDDVVKIGRTGRSELEGRLKELSKETGVPCPFECYVAYEMDNHEQIEDIMHTIYRGVGRHTDTNHKKKEFFRVEPGVADAVLSKLAGLMNGKRVNVDEDKVYTKDQIETIQENLATNRTKEKSFVFSDYKIPVGAQLVFLNDDSITCTVKVAKGKTRVEYKGKEYSLSRLTQELLNSMGYKGTNYNGYKYWLYDGKILFDMRSRNEE